MSVLIILRGNSGSGKTSAAIALQKRFGANTMRISHDMVRREMLHVWGEEGVLKSEPLMIELLKYGAVNSNVTIMEGILPVKSYERLFEAAKEVFADHIFAYYYDLSFEETLSRHHTKPNCMEFGEEEMRSWWQEKDYLPMIQETLLERELSLDDAVEMIYGQVTAALMSND